jgi:hypothetical protein
VGPLAQAGLNEGFGLAIGLGGIGLGASRAHLKAPQHSVVTGIQFADTERLGELVVGTEFESDHAVNFIAGTTCQNNDEGVRTGTNFPEQIEPIALAEAQLENDRTWVLAN